MILVEPEEERAIRKESAVKGIHNLWRIGTREYGAHQRMNGESSEDILVIHPKEVVVIADLGGRQRTHVSRTGTGIFAVLYFERSWAGGAVMSVAL